MTASQTASAWKHSATRQFVSTLVGGSLVCRPCVALWRVSMRMEPRVALGLGVSRAQGRARAASWALPAVATGSRLLRLVRSVTAWLTTSLGASAASSTLAHAIGREADAARFVSVAVVAATLTHSVALWLLDVRVSWMGWLVRGALAALAITAFMCRESVATAWRLSRTRERWRTLTALTRW